MPSGQAQVITPTPAGGLKDVLKVVKGMGGSFVRVRLGVLLRRTAICVHDPKGFDRPPPISSDGLSPYYSARH
jgi:hypothetical protein